VRIIAFITDEPAIHCILSDLGEPTAPPEAAPARAPPLWEQGAQVHWDDTPAPAPQYGFDQRVSWLGACIFGSAFLAGLHSGADGHVLPRRPQERQRRAPPITVG
jgi:hypothetical protein